MEIKSTIQGVLVYQVLGLYVLAFLAGLVKFVRLRWVLYALAFLVSIAALIYRGLHAGHFPLQNMFEVFLFLGALAFPMSVLSKRLLQVEDFNYDLLLGIVILFPAGFVFSADPQHLPPALQSGLFVPHVLSYMIAYVILAKAATLAGRELFGHADCETLSYRFVCLGFPLLTVGLILGSVWAKLAWSDYWSWDPKELWSLATWFVYVGYFHFRARFPNNKKSNSMWVIMGLIFIVITLLWVNLSRIFSGLHNYA